MVNFIVQHVYLKFSKLFRFIFCCWKYFQQLQYIIIWMYICFIKCVQTIEHHQNAWCTFAPVLIHTYIECVGCSHQVASVLFENVVFSSFWRLLLWKFRYRASSIFATSLYAPNNVEFSHKNSKILYLHHIVW